MLISNAELRPLVLENLKTSALDEKVPVSQTATVAIRHFLNFDAEVAAEAGPILIPVVVKVVNEKPFDAKKAAVVTLKVVAKHSPAVTSRSLLLFFSFLLFHQVIAPHLKLIVPPLMLAVKEKNVPVKLASERALLYCLELKKGTQIMDVSGQYLRFFIQKV